MVAINNFNKFYITDATNNTMPHQYGQELARLLYSTLIRDNIII